MPLYDDSAFLVASLTNDSGELLLPGMAQLFRDGTYVGRSHIELVPAGEVQPLRGGQQGDPQALKQPAGEKG